MKGLNNIYVTGYSENSGAVHDYATIKYDPNGNQKWVARYNRPANSSDSDPAIALDGSDNIYVTGGSYGSSTELDTECGRISVFAGYNDKYQCRTFC